MRYINDVREWKKEVKVHNRLISKFRVSKLNQIAHLRGVVMLESRTNVMAFDTTSKLIAPLCTEDEVGKPFHSVIKKGFSSVIADENVLELALAACNLTLSAYVLTDSLTTSFYPTLVPGHNILIGFLLAGILSADQVNYQGWLPALLMNTTHCFTKKVCGYCAIIPDSLRFTVYHGDYLKLLEKYNINKGFGNKDAKVWVIMLDDPYCPFCARLELQSGDWIKSMIKEGKMFYTVVEVAWHRNLPGYNESVNLAYELQKYVEEGKMDKFFNLRMKIIQELSKLVRGNETISSVKSVPKGWVEKQTEIARALFPVQATPVLVFVNKDSGKAIAVIGALPTQVLQWAYQVALKLK